MMVAIWGPEKYKAHCEMCAFKYRMRAGKKSDDWETDLRKAEWYDHMAKEVKVSKSLVTHSDLWTIGNRTDNDIHFEWHEIHAGYYDFVVTFQKDKYQILGKMARVDDKKYQKDIYDVKVMVNGLPIYSRIDKWQHLFWSKFKSFWHYIRNRVEDMENETKGSSSLLTVNGWAKKHNMPEQFVHECWRNDKCDIAAFLIQRGESPFEVLVSSFNWKDTIDGFDYWSACSQGMLNNEAKKYAGQINENR